MIGDELGERLVSFSFRATGKLTAETLKKVFNLILKKGGLLMNKLLIIPQKRQIPSAILLIVADTHTLPFPYFPSVQTVGMHC